jgi:hypothetical protein
MSETRPDFLLVEARGEGFFRDGVPRSCWVRSKLRDTLGERFLLVEIDPRVPLARGRQVRRLVLQARVVGVPLLPEVEFPCPVYVYRILDDRVEAGVVKPDYLRPWVWGNVVRFEDPSRPPGESA